MCFKWHNSPPPESENVAQPFWHRIRGSWRLMRRSSPIFLLGLLSGLVDMSQTLTAFAWTPIFAHLTRIYRLRPAFGGAFSAFAAAALLGFTVSRMMVFRKLSFSAALTAASG